MFALIFLSALIPSCALITSRVSARQTRLCSTSNDFNPKSMVGSSGPFGFFDPASFTKDITEGKFKMYQEAEIKHARVAMLAFLGLVFGEKFHIFFNGEITGPAIYQFQQADAILPPFWGIVLAMIGAIEASSIINSWQSVDETMKNPTGIAELRKSHIAGDNGFDPLGLKPKSEASLKKIKVKELNNGRLAM